MIISNERRIVIYLTPKTGSQTIWALFRDLKIPTSFLTNNGHVYRDLLTYPERFKLEGNLNDFREFGFYRDPYERAVSIVNYMRIGTNHSKFFHAFYGDSIRVNSVSRKSYHEWTDEMRAACDAVPFIDVFRRFRWFFERGGFGRTQEPWLGRPNTKLLNYANYRNEIVDLFKEFDVDLSNRELPRVNETIKLPEKTIITPEDEAEIREYVKPDYEFLASRGIRFS